MSKSRTLHIELEYDPKRVLWLYRSVNFIWLALGLAAALAAIQFWVDPASVRETALHHHLGIPIDYIWNAAYMFGGAWLAVGVWFRKERAELIGHLFFSAAIFVNLIAILVTIPAGVTLATFIGLFLGSVGRGVYIWHSLVVEGREP